MFKSMKRIIKWAGKYKGRLYLGSVFSFFSSLSTAIPTMAAAYALDKAIAAYWAGSTIESSLIWQTLWIIVGSIALNFLLSYLRAVLQESIGYEVAAGQRIHLGDVLKRVPLGYFSKNSVGDILTGVTTELSTLELQGMKMVDIIINGYAKFIAILLCFLFLSPAAAVISVVGVAFSSLALHGISRHSEKTADITHQAMEDKSIFRAAKESKIIDNNPTIYLTAKGGGVPQKDKAALTDEQAARLLDAIQGLPPYVFVMLGLYAGLRREEILALKWDSVYLNVDCPYLTVRRAWHTENNRPVIMDELKTKAAHRNIPLPVCLADCLKETKANSQSEYVVPNRDGDPLSYTQFKRLWQYIVTRTVKERFYYRYEDGKRVKHTVTPILGEKAAHNGKVIYSLDFEVTPHQLRHTYITNLIHSSVDPKTVQYLAGHESSKITMDIYAKVKYNRPDELVRTMGGVFAQWDAAQA